MAALELDHLALPPEPFPAIISQSTAKKSLRQNPTAGDHDDIRDVFDLDSMDFTNLIAAIHERKKISIPEAEHNKLFTLESGVAYLRNALARLQS